jgi:hypothetical protein
MITTNFSFNLRISKGRLKSFLQKEKARVQKCEAFIDSYFNQGLLPLMLFLHELIPLFLLPLEFRLYEGGQLYIYLAILFTSGSRQRYPVSGQPFSFNRTDCTVFISPIMSRVYIHNTEISQFTYFQLVSPRVCQKAYGFMRLRTLIYELCSHMALGFFPYNATHSNYGDQISLPRTWIHAHVHISKRHLTYTVLNKKYVSI